MNENIIENLSIKLNIKKEQINNTLKLLNEGATVPFIARYRKEVTGSLNEDQIREISNEYEYSLSLLNRKNEVIRLIDEKGLLTEEIKNNILNASKLVEVEDIYRPYKEKKKTKATEAIKNGLEGLAKIIMSQPDSGTLDSISSKFLNDNVKTTEDAITGASYIIAEWVSDNAYYRKYIRNYIFNNGLIKTKKKKDSIDEEKVYEMYYEFSESIKHIKPHRVLAINRAEKEGIISVNIDIDEQEIFSYLYKKCIKKENNFLTDVIKNAINDSYKRLIFPSVEREIRKELKDISEERAIENFMSNLEALLLTPPLKGKVVLGFDPAYRTGCKLAVLSPTGEMLHIDVIYPHEPKNEKEASEKKLVELIKKYNIEIIAIGNGTASRESESFVADVIKKNNLDVKFSLVSEAGASVYSANSVAKEEFPTLHVEQRSAISIGRRIQDPLSELVKIDPESIGVGLYQHDVNEKKLSESLNFTVEKVVNQVGVNINTASKSILKYISGLTKASTEKIINYRNKNKITTRNELLKNKILSEKIYEQSIGFLRVIDGNNPLDKTSVHPESYELTEKLLNLLNLNKEDIGTDEFKNVISKANILDLKEKLNCNIVVLEDIIKALTNPLMDPRDNLQAPILKSDVLHIEDLKKGMKLEGTVRNVVDFGCFVDIGIKSDGLVHISKMSKSYIKDPKDIVSVGDIVTVYVDEVNLEKNKVQLSFIEN